jgi:tRNA threonylcarbamoyladenosine biosynthesis protein TsaE
MQNYPTAGMMECHPLKYICAMDWNYTLDAIGASAEKFLSVAGAYRVIAFEGDMGAGKTTFIKALCMQLGVQGKVQSPTFPIINEYVTIQAEIIYHIDLYRLSGVEDARMAGVEDAVRSGNLCFLEWPGIAESLLPAETLRVQIKTVGPDERKLVFNL